MIRQAISCDICGTEKKQTNHWFVASEQGSELRVSGWDARHRLRPGSKHLCGQTCLHKLVDEFMARTLAARPQASAGEDYELAPAVAATDASLTSNAAYAYAANAASACADAQYAEIESSARLVPTPPAVLARRAKYPLEFAAATPISGRLANNESTVDGAVMIPDEPSGFDPRNWRVEAWKRERERETRAATTARRASL